MISYRKSQKKQLLTSDREDYLIIDMYLSLYVSDQNQSRYRDLDEFKPKIKNGLRNSYINFGSDQDHSLDPGFFLMISYHWCNTHIVVMLCAFHKGFTAEHQLHEITGLEIQMSAYKT